MGNARALVKRRKAIRNIRKITRTMELIATSRFKKAMDRAAEAAAYTRKINEIVADLSQSDLTFSHPLLEQPAETKNVTLLILTSNRGLCGGYNGGVLRKANAELKKMKSEGLNVTVDASGKRGISSLKFEGISIENEFTQFEDKPTFEEVNEIADRYLADFTAGRTHRLIVAYQSFQSAARQSPVVETILPFGDLAADETSASGVDYEFLPSPEEILAEIVPAAFKARFFKCFLDAGVGEQIARMVAMKSATENADDMIKDLSMKYNRARQTQITSELSEIIGGAAALE